MAKDWLGYFQSSNIPTYEKLNAFMESAKPTVYTGGNAEGIDRVRKEDGLYAFFMEAAAIEYHTERICDLTQIGGLLDRKGYGVALPPGKWSKKYTSVLGSISGRGFNRFNKTLFCNRISSQGHPTQRQFLTVLWLCKKKASFNNWSISGGRRCMAPEIVLWVIVTHFCCYRLLSPFSLRSWVVFYPPFSLRSWVLLLVTLDQPHKLFSQNCFHVVGSLIL